MKRIKIWMVALLSLTIVGGLLMPAQPAQAATHHTVSWWLAYEKGKYLGPNADTSWGRMTITGFAACGGHYYKIYKITQYPNPTTAGSVDAGSVRAGSVRAGSLGTGPVAPSAADPPATISPSVCPTGMHPDSWWNPFSWNWEHILGIIWNDIVAKCMRGALSGAVGTASTSLATKLIAKVATIKVGPQGYAIAAIAGCTVGLVS
jgi:hypothetical protein